MRAMLSRATARGWRWRAWPALACLLSSAAAAQVGPGQSGSPAQADDGPHVRQRRWAVSLERLLGYADLTRSWLDPAPASTTHERAISVFGIPATCSWPYGCTTFARSAFELPRVGLDYFVLPQASVGLAAALAIYSETIGGGGFSSHRVVSYAVAPRIGYSHAWNGWIGVWARGGVSYVKASREVRSPDDLPEGSLLTISAWALTVEALAVITPRPDLAITVGPNADVGLAGSADEGEDHIRVRTTDLGVHAGLAAFF